ncbi:MBL fold metallo-hydrolase [uncultured Microscilla sp.]|uniref:MBL fold metallo-hydrolase n=1 Tax=uncultured Microscilla sp. TaxID=432653 RepID=UPI0026240B51|nr:MBL fold metallo-hydrolase [uncultured Microscilla sp.]
MKVTVLGSGTSQGVPVIACDCEVCQSLDYRDQRLRAAIHIEVDNQSIVVDTGPDFRQQMLRERITSLDAVLYTHQHKDHTAGMDDLRSFNFKQEKDVPVYARAEVMQQLKQEFAYIFVAKEKKYPGVLNIEEFTIENRPFDIHGTTIIPIEVLHHKLPVFGFRVQNFTYVTDTNYIADSEIEKMKGTEYLILDALRKEEHISHFNIDQALEVIAKVQPKQAYLTHISHKMGLHADVDAELPENVHLAYDGLQIEC